MTGEEKKKYTEKNLLDAVNFREPDKIPVGMEVANWPFAYNGGTYAEVMDDPFRAAEAYAEMLKDIEVDWMWAPPGVSKPMRAYEKLGIDNYVIGPDGTNIGHNQANEHIMADEDYPKFIEDPFGFWKETLTKERVPSFQKPYEEAYADVIEALKAWKSHMFMNILIGDKFDKAGLFVTTWKGARYDIPLDTIFDRVRGIKNTLIDLRRRPEMVEAACDRIHEQTMAKMRVLPKDIPVPPDEYICGTTVYHSACFLTPKQFQRHFIYYLKKDYMEYMEKGGRFFVKGEGRFLYTLEQYRDLPKGAFMFMLEADDPIDVKKEIGDWATVAAGITTNMLKLESKEKCIEHTKYMYDNLAPGGGFAFLQDKPFCAATDVNKENVIAVWKFANEYGLKK